VLSRNAAALFSFTQNGECAIVLYLRNRAGTGACPYSRLSYLPSVVLTAFNMPMPVELSVKHQIYQTIDALPTEQLPELLHLLKQFIEAVKPEAAPPVAPIYQIHQQAIDTGLTDLAAQHDHYLYGTAKRNA
jgi:hypothetical protein